MYPAIKHLHLTFVAISIALFTLRFAWMAFDSPMLQRRWVKVLPHVNDTLLLVAGLVLTTLVGQYPFVDGWLTAKVLALLAYIVLGALALKRAPTKAARLACGVAAYVAFGYMLLVALRHTPTPW